MGKSKFVRWGEFDGRPLADSYSGSHSSIRECDNSLDCRAIQQGSRLRRPFDARSLCHAVVVPFDRDNHRVLGGSPEPYVNNPLRIPSISPDHRGAQRNKEEFDDLCAVLEYAEQHPSRAENLLLWTLFCVRERLGKRSYHLSGAQSSQSGPVRTDSRQVSGPEDGGCPAPGRVSRLVSVYRRAFRPFYARRECDHQRFRRGNGEVGRLGLPVGRRTSGNGRRGERPTTHPSAHSG